QSKASSSHKSTIKSQVIDRFQLMRALETRFELLDKNKTGTLEYSEFEKLITGALGLQELTPDMTEIVQKLFKQTDRSATGVTKQDIMEMLLSDNLQEKLCRKKSHNGDDPHYDSLAELH